MSTTEKSRSNSEFPWDDFNSAAYFSRNYSSLCEEDQAILEIVRDFFATTADVGLSGIDVGAGTNLYPALAMLPWCSEITLLDRSRSNVQWLEQEVKKFQESWDPFWELLQKNPRYGEVLDARKEISTRVKVLGGDVFELERQRWEIGTMFFVACSFSSLQNEFGNAVDCFLSALTPGAPFAMAYMEGSKGYEVAGQSFPAVSLTIADVRNLLKGRVDRLAVDRIPPGEERLREGYTGMLVACGCTRRKSLASSRKEEA